MFSKVFRVYRKFAGVLSGIKNHFTHDPYLERFIQHNLKTWGPWAQPQGESIVLMDLFPMYAHYFGREYVANILAKKHSARIVTFSLKKIFNQKLKRLYRSFNTSEFLEVKFSREIRRQGLALATELFKNIKTKADLLDFCIDGQNIGLDIYETYLRERHQPTLRFGDPALFRMFVRGITTWLYWDQFFQKNKVCGAILSHNCYIAYGTPLRAALKHKVPVYLAEVYGGQLILTNPNCYDNFHLYHEMFSRLPAEQQKSELEWAKARLDLRFNGVVGVDMGYSTKSAFGRPNASERYLRESPNVKVLICTHCFYDNPHGYGRMLFPDFYEWFSFLNEVAKQTDYDWYVKTHPDFLPGTLETIQEILGSDSKIKVLPAHASHLQMRDEGIDYVLTCNGTVGMEYPLLGIQAISIGNNPRLAYDFNFQAQSVEEYRRLLLSLKDRPKKVIKPEEVYELYAMFRKLIRIDDLAFPSFQQFAEEAGKGALSSSIAYKYFLDQLTPERHAAIVQRWERYIDSGVRHFCDFAFSEAKAAAAAAPAKKREEMARV